MTFAKGNRLWEIRSTCGPKLKYDSAEKLWEACVAYFEWVEDNPLWEAKVFAYQGEITHTKIPKMRAMTNAGLCLHIGISQQTWADWRRSRDDLSGVIQTVDNNIREQKFTGAAADLLNANIISRDLGLADKSEIMGKDGGPIQTEETSARERIAGRLAGLTAGSDSESDPGGAD